MTGLAPGIEILDIISFGLMRIVAGCAFDRTHRETFTLRKQLGLIAVHIQLIPASDGYHIRFQRIPHFIPKARLQQDIVITRMTNRTQIDPLLSAEQGEGNNKF